MCYGIVEPCSPLIVLASIIYSKVFSALDIKKMWYNSLTFYIYLIHAGVWDFIVRVTIRAIGENVIVKTDGMTWIPVFVVIVFAISYVLSKLYVWLWEIIGKKKRITNMLLRMVHL